MSVLVRCRNLRQPATADVLEFPNFQGSLAELLGWVETEALSAYWVDLNPRLRLGERGAELFRDRLYAGVDVVVCGHTFVRKECRGYLELYEWYPRPVLKADL